MKSITLSLIASLLCAGQVIGVYAAVCSTDGGDGCPPVCQDSTCCSLPRVVPPPDLLGRPELPAAGPAAAPREQAPLPPDPGEIFHVPRPATA